MDTEVVQIELDRGTTGLGFNIRGGSDIPHIPGDTGIFVAKIRKDGAASKDGRLQEGDKILEINGTNVKCVAHEEAVKLFLTAGDKVSLKIEPGAEKKLLGKIGGGASGPEPSSSNIRPLLLVIGMSAIAVSVFFGFRYYKANLSKS